MELNENAQIDTDQVTDSRGSAGRGGLGGLGIPVGGGLIGTLITIGLVVLGAVVGPGLLNGGKEGTGGGSGDLGQTCAASNPDRFKLPECRNTLYINSIQNYWQKALPEGFGKAYQKVDTVFFAQAVNTGCGPADSGVGPFYCPEDNLVYIDLTFYTELANRFGAKGEFAQPYVLAHEYGHHVQTLLGTESQVRRQQQRDPGNANKLSVMMELQADCFAGAWAKHATETTDAGGQPIFKSITQADIDQALDAAAAIGDDTIQKKAGGRVDESKFTHGTSEQRKNSFGKGYATGDPKQCDTFAGAL
jgi:predicted metalloprotease